MQIEFGAYKVVNWEEAGLEYRDSFWHVINIYDKVIDMSCVTKFAAIAWAKKLDQQDIATMDRMMDGLLVGE